MSKELRSLLRDLIPELILSQKRHIYMGPIRTVVFRKVRSSLVTRVRKRYPSRWRTLRKTCL